MASASVSSSMRSTLRPMRRRSRAAHRTVVPASDVRMQIDGPAGMAELDDAPGRCEFTWRSRRHAGQGHGDLRDGPRLRELAFQADVTDFPWAQMSDQASPDVERQ